ncbi:serine/threonine-protein kinase [Alicyclobacillus dauci]|uniref:Serine/threonine protein kinase n=1 Tax=Alicyclobacillus dauci TaxID=1475485 RepID=A0ABY6ZAS6_9BACL|nr:hypothetical protein [Alicyclobacillus dauci]WAH39336.1 hypothetical protein NZD86_23505 [Alicyclobacillus dauci]
MYDYQYLRDNYPLIGEGRQGKVFQISPDRCLKYYDDPKHAVRERASYEAGQGSPIIPKLYEGGPNYIIIEYLQAPSLQQYLLGPGRMSKSLAKQILSALKEMERLGFTRIDVAPFHLFVMEDKKVKIIDLVNAFHKTSPVPYVLLSGLHSIGFLETFYGHVQNLDAKTAAKWAEVVDDLVR